MVQVCRKMFLSTTSLGRYTVETWVKKSTCDMNISKTIQNEERNNCNHMHLHYHERVAFVNTFFDDSPKQPSHYMRKDTIKLCLEQHFTTIKQLHIFYKDEYEKQNRQCLGRKKFKQCFQEKNLSLF